MMDRSQTKQAWVMGVIGSPTDSLQDQGTKQPGIQKSQSFIYMGSLNWIISGLF